MHRSSGLAIGFNLCTIKVTTSWGGLRFLGMDIFSADIGTNIWFINVYGPCHRREEFWQRFLILEITTFDHLVIGGDLNFSIGFGESWGSQAQVDPLSEYFRNPWSSTTSRMSP